VAIDAGTEMLDNGYIVSRHLDDKAGCAAMLAAMKAMVDSKVEVPVDIHFIFTITEEVGSGASAVLLEHVVAMVSIDNGATAEGQNSAEFGVTIGMADQVGPFDYHLTRKLLRLCEEKKIPHQRDVFRYYRSDSASAIGGGADVRTALITFGIDASHSYERSTSMRSNPSPAGLRLCGEPGGDRARLRGAFRSEGLHEPADQAGAAQRRRTDVLTCAIARRIWARFLEESRDSLAVVLGEAEPAHLIAFRDQLLVQVRLQVERIMVLISARPSGGSDASLEASASTSESSWSSSTHFQISPHSSAFSAGSGSPVSARPNARACPTRRGKTQVPPLSGMRPIAEKLWMNFAERAATTMSQASAILAPAPAATPLTRAISGCGRLVSIWTSGFQQVSTVTPRSTGCSSDETARSLRSWPAQKKSAAGSGQDHHSRFGRMVEGVSKLFVHPHSEAVEAFRPVEGDPRDIVGLLKDDGFVAGQFSLPLNSFQGPFRRPAPPYE
jgi:hypothetical protein